MTLEVQADRAITARRPREPTADRPTTFLLASAGRSVGIFAEGMCIAVGKDLHHPAIKVIHRVVHDGLEAPVVLSMSFLNVVPQTIANIFVLASQLHLLRT